MECDWWYHIIHSDLGKERDIKGERLREAGVLAIQQWLSNCGFRFGIFSELHLKHAKGPGGMCSHSLAGSFQNAACFSPAAGTSEAP